MGILIGEVNILRFWICCVLLFTSFGFCVVLLLKSDSDFWIVFKMLICRVWLQRWDFDDGIVVY